MLTFILIISLAAVLFFLYGIHRYVLDKRYRLPPGPPPLPFIGNMHQMSDKKYTWKAFRDLGKQYDSISTFYLGQLRLIVLNSPDVINEAIVKNGRKLSDRPSAVIPGFEDFPLGVLFASGERWQQGRRFALKAMRDFGMGKMAIVENIHDEVGHFLAEVNERTFRPFDPRQLLSNAVSNVICTLVFGKRFSYNDPEFIRFLILLNQMTSRPISNRISYFALPILSYINRPKEFKGGLEIVSMVQKILKQAIEEHRRDFSAENIRDFPDLFIQAEMTDEAIDFDFFSIVMHDMFIAGTETTATALNWTLFYLSTYPDIQRKCHDAIDRVIDTDRYPVLADRTQLVYIDAVMCEVMRHATIVPTAIFHFNQKEPVQISGYEIPIQSAVVYNVWGVHHDPTYWSEPERFNPDRWISADGKLLQHSSHFMPFGIGPRICLGELLARVEYFVFLVALLQRFTFALADAKVSIKDSIASITHSPPKYKLVASKR